MPEIAERPGPLAALWQVDAAPVFEALVRRSFKGYVALMLERSTRESGLQPERAEAYASAPSAPLG